MRLTESFTVMWTDGGDPAHSGYFDGAGPINDLLLILFAGKHNWHHEPLPITTHVMEDVTYGTPLKITVTIEEIK